MVESIYSFYATGRESCVSEEEVAYQESCAGFGGVESAGERVRRPRVVRREDLGGPC